MAAAKAANAEEALVAKKMPESMYESNYVHTSAEEQMDGMDAALDMLIQIEPSSETMKAVQAAKAAMKASKANKAAPQAIEQKVSVAPSVGGGIYSASMDPSAEEQ